MRIHRPRDFWAGLLFTAIGVGVMVGARRYPFGTGAAMGPGYFPSVLGGILVALGLLELAFSIRRRARPKEEPVPFQARPVLVVLGSVVLFGAALSKLGLVAASMLLVGVSRTASRDFRWREVLAFAALLTLFCAAVFVWGLKMPMPLWPAFARG